MVEKEAVAEEEGEGGAEVEDVVEPMDRGDVAVQVLPNLQTSSGEIQLRTFLYNLLQRELVPMSPSSGYCSQPL